MQYLSIAFVFLLCTVIVLGFPQRRLAVILTIWFGLYVSQIFILVPGSDASEWSYGNYNTYSFAGLSYSTWISILLIYLCMLEILLTNPRMIPRRDAHVLLPVLVFFLFGMLVSANFGESVQDAIKLLFPFVLYYFFAWRTLRVDAVKIKYAVLAINLFLVGQVLVCKLLTGKFAANHYYWYVMDEEFFGYYNSPHPFAGVLGLISIWNLWQIGRREHPLFNTALFLCNIVLVFASGVKTYALSVLIAVGIVSVCSLFNSRLRNLRKYVLLTVFAAVLCGGFIAAWYSTSRLNIEFNPTSLTSGRDSRWEKDLDYFVEQRDAARYLFGNGIGGIYFVNDSLIGRHINSLNVFIDLLVDDGILGMALILYAYYSIFRRAFRGGAAKPVVVAMVCYIVISSFINNLLPYVTIMPIAMTFVHLLSVAGGERPEKRERVRQA
jgi:hypothetical protein